VAMLYAWQAKRSQGGSSLENQKLQEGALAHLKRKVI